MPTDAPAPTEAPAPTASATPEATPKPVGPGTAEDPANPVAPPSPTGSAAPAGPGNGGTRPAAEPKATNTALTLPVGLAGCFFALTGDIDLGDYTGISDTTGVSAYNTWVPIGTIAANGATNAFLGTFDGKDHAVFNFYYPQEKAFLSTQSPGGFGLFGSLGASALVKNLEIRPLNQPTGHWDLGIMGSAVKTTSGVTARTADYRVGVLAGMSGGSIENCTVTNAKITYTYDSAETAVGIVQIGGLVGQVTGGSLTKSAFLGSIKAGNDSSKTPPGYYKQQVGGLVGAVTGAAALTNCAAGVDMDVYNGIELANVQAAWGGVGGLVGRSEAPLTLSGCFTSGLVQTLHEGGGLVGNVMGALTALDCYSTIALGDIDIAKNISPLATEVQEAMGGLFGRVTGANSTLNNSYFAGSLLEPQFGAIAGYNSGLTCTNVAADPALALVAPYKENSKETLVLKTPAEITGAAWTAKAGAYPALLWADPATPPATVTRNETIFKDLSDFSAKQWVVLDANNAVKGNDGAYTIYRLKDATGTPKLGELVLDLNAYYPQTGTGPKTGALYKHAQTVPATNGTSLPVVRKGLYAPNQTEGSANIVSDSASLARFLDLANFAGGGSLGSKYSIAGTVTGIPVPNYTGGKPFCGTLDGTGGGAISGLSFPTAGSVGLFD
ncbi:MAG: GLUG motif-containing protein, partial [Pseudoflavonifractor sp.]